MGVKVTETTHGVPVHIGSILSWNGRNSGARRFGKVVRINGEVMIKTSTDSNWTLEEFSWAVAEGRIEAESIRVPEDCFAHHEIRYLSS